MTLGTKEQLSAERLKRRNYYLRKLYHRILSEDKIFGQYEKLYSRQILLKRAWDNHFKLYPESKLVAPSPFLLDGITVNVGQAVKPAHGLKPLPSDLASQFSDYKSKLTSTTVVLRKRDGTETLIKTRADDSRYFAHGLVRVKRTVRSRLGRFWFSPGVLLSLTYDPDKISRDQAWTQVGTDLRRLLDSINKIRQRKHARAQLELPRDRRTPYQRLKYVWAVEEQHEKNAGMPHLHVFFPQLRYLVSLDKLPELWHLGGNDCKYKDNINVSAYVCKYVGKMDSMSDYSQSMMWFYKKRLWGCTRSYRLPERKQFEGKVPSEWGLLGAWRGHSNLEVIDNVTNWHLRPCNYSESFASAVSGELADSLKNTVTGLWAVAN